MTSRQEAARLRRDSLLAKDPDYFKKLAAKGKGKKAPGRGFAANKDLAREAGAKGGKSRGTGTKAKQVAKSDALHKQIKDEIEAKEKKNQQRVAKIKRTKNINKVNKEWGDDNETTDFEW